MGAGGEGPEVVLCNCGCHAANYQQQEVLQAGSEEVVAMTECFECLETFNLNC